MTSWKSSATSITTNRKVSLTMTIENAPAGKKNSRQKLARNQSVQREPAQIAVSADGSVLILEFDRPVVVSGPIDVLTDIGGPILEQNIVGPLQVNVVFTNNVESANYQIPPNQIAIRTFQGGPNAGAVGSLAGMASTLAEVLAEGNSAGGLTIADLGAGTADNAIAVNANSVTSLDGGLIRTNGKGALNIAAATSNAGVAGLTGALLQIRCAAGPAATIQPRTVGSTVPGSINFPVSQLNVSNPLANTGTELSLAILPATNSALIVAVNTPTSLHLPLAITPSELSLQTAPNGQGSPTDGYVTTTYNTLDDGAGNLTAITLNAQNGASGTFLTADAKTVTVTNGIITDIA